MIKRKNNLFIRDIILKRKVLIRHLYNSVRPYYVASIFADLLRFSVLIDFLWELQTSEVISLFSNVVIK